jgi:hypothetical protein
MLVPSSVVRESSTLESALRQYGQYIVRLLSVPVKLRLEKLGTDLGIILWVNGEILWTAL